MATQQLSQGGLLAPRRSASLIYAQPLPDGDFESIATVTVGSGGASSIEFTSIPGGFQHLQIRAVVRTNRAAAFDTIDITFNNSSSNYAHHVLYGGGSSFVGAEGYASQSKINTAGFFGAALAGASQFGVMVLDILDYASTNKNKTARHFSGVDNNGSGWVGIGSGLWADTSAISSVRLVSGTGANFVQFSTAALYGLRAP